MKPDVFLPVGAAIAFIVPLVTIVAPLISDKLETKEDPPAQQRMVSDAPPDHMMVGQAARLERQACGCKDASCADRVAESIAMWGRENAVQAVSEKTSKTLRASLNRALACTSTQLATRLPAENKPTTPPAAATP